MRDETGCVRIGGEFEIIDRIIRVLERKGQLGRDRGGQRQIEHIALVETGQQHAEHGRCAHELVVDGDFAFATHCLICVIEQKCDFIGDGKRIGAGRCIDAVETLRLKTGSDLHKLVACRSIINALVGDEARVVRDLLRCGGNSVGFTVDESDATRASAECAAEICIIDAARDEVGNLRFASDLAFTTSNVNGKLQLTDQHLVGEIKIDFAVLDDAEFDGRRVSDIGTGKDEIADAELDLYGNDRPPSLELSGSCELAEEKFCR